VQKSTQPISINQIIEIILRRRWLIMLPCLLSLLVGLYLAVTLPRIYTAETLILVQPPKVPTDYIRSTVPIGIESRINTISQQIMSRTNLEKIIRQFNLFSGPRNRNLFMEEKIEKLRDRISVGVTSSSDESGADSFQIGFFGTEPERVMNIANSLAAFFIEENLKDREAQAVSASDFFEEELNSITTRLEERESRLKEYRENYMGGLPEQLEANLRTIDRLQLQLNAKQLSLGNAKNRLANLESQGRQLGRPLRQTPAQATGNVPTDDIVKLEIMRQELQQLLAKYTDRHPDVVRQRKIVAELEAKLTAQAGVRSAKTPNAPAQKQTAAPAKLNPNAAAIDETRREIGILQNEINKLNAQIRYHQALVEDTPKREQELLSIQRDYENIQETYNSLLKRKLEAELSVNMEKKQKGEQFRILDPARLPERPSEPNMKRLFVLSLALGLAIGGGIVFLLEYSDQSFRRTEDLEAFTRLPVIATIPMISNARQRLWSRINWACSMFSTACIMALLLGFAFIALKGIDKAMAVLSRYITV
jgi:polysaccharide chain length determinant protein (PEP-CTERM system associated)